MIGWLHRHRRTATTESRFRVVRPFLVNGRDAAAGEVLSLPELGVDIHRARLLVRHRMLEIVEPESFVNGGSLTTGGNASSPAVTMKVTPGERITVEPPSKKATQPPRR